MNARWLGCLGMGLLWGSCVEKPPGPPVKDPPQVFLSTLDTTVVAPSFSVTVNVVGCDSVEHAELQNAGQFLKVLTYKQSPTTFELTSSDFATIYPSLGFAAPLVLSVKAFCADKRSNTSSPSFSNAIKAA